MDESRAKKDHESKTTWIIWGAGLLMLIIFFGVWTALLPLVKPLLLPQQSSKTGYARAMELWSTDRPQATELIEQAIAEAASKQDRSEEISLRRGYAQTLWSSGETVPGNEQIEKCIALMPANPDPGDANMLATLYAERGLNAFKVYRESHTQPSGVEDLEKSLSVAERAYSWNNVPTPYRAASLALAYQVTGEKEKSKKLMEKVIAAVSSDQPASDVRWFADATCAQLAAMDGNYSAATNALCKALSETSDSKNQEEIVDDFTTGLLSMRKRNQKILSVRTLFANNNYAAIDAMATEMIKAKSRKWNGDWLVDDINQEIDVGSDNEGQIKTQIQKTKDWLKANPDSPVARSALVEALTHYAWFARGCGTADTVTSEGWQLFKERLEEANQVMLDDDNAFAKTPHAYDAYATVALGTGLPKDEYYELLADCHKQWPGYLAFDRDALYYLQPRWFGDTDNEWERFAAKRADEIGGPAGDAAYAVMVNDARRYFQGNIFDKTDASWPRVKAGFAQIFKDYPNDVRPRAVFIQLAALSDDVPSLKTALVGFKDK